MKKVHMATAICILTIVIIIGVCVWESRDSKETVATNSFGSMTFTEKPGWNKKIEAGTMEYVYDDVLVGIKVLEIDDEFLKKFGNAQNDKKQMINKSNERFYPEKMRTGETEYSQLKIGEIDAYRTSFDGNFTVFNQAINSEVFYILLDFVVDREIYSVIFTGKTKSKDAVESEFQRFSKSIVVSKEKQKFNAASHLRMEQFENLKYQVGDAYDIKITSNVPGKQYVQYNYESGRFYVCVDEISQKTEDEKFLPNRIMELLAPREIKLSQLEDFTDIVIAGKQGRKASYEILKSPTVLQSKVQIVEFENATQIYRIIVMGVLQEEESQNEFERLVESCSLSNL